uniref:Uncharacterized protein n=2 Tax=Anopheles triannulatus TaxID=58253 RepID=A0A2M4AKK7_9DIPT
MLPSLSIRRPAWRSGLLLNVPVRARARPAGCCWPTTAAPSRSAPFRLAVSRPDEFASARSPAQATTSGDRIPGPSGPSSVPSSYWPHAAPPHPPPSGSLLFSSCSAAQVALPSFRPAAPAPCNGPSRVSRWVPSSEMLDRNDIAASRRRMRFLLLIELAMNWGTNNEHGKDGVLCVCLAAPWQKPDEDADRVCSGKI